MKVVKGLMLGISLFSCLAQAEQTEVLPSIVSVECRSVFESKVTTRVKSSRKVGREGATKTMSLRVGKESFKVTQAVTDTGASDEQYVLTLEASSKKAGRMELMVDLLQGGGDENFSEATISINGVAQDYLKFECRVLFAG